MVDFDLALEVSDMTQNGTMKDDPRNILKLMELMKQISEEDEELKEELEDMDKIVGQMIITDKAFCYWLSSGEGIFNYGEGLTEDPTFTMKANWQTMEGIMSGEVDGTAAYMSGDLIIEGNIQDVMGYAEFMRIAVEVMQKLGQE
ncbi:MAG: SCP2 sterol-binding domain-containing protein [Promethearchaeota archaeon]|jgi:putative sterol carrier protein